MESNKLSVLEKSLPLKAYPEKSLDQILHTEFMYWVSNLLSLKEDKEESVLNALPEVKYHFHSLGLNEVKKAFEMYARGHLNIKPIPNYFDVILVGQIFNEYKAQKTKVKKEIIMAEPTQEEKENLIYMGVINCFDEFKQSNNIIDGYVWVYDHLDEIGVLNYSVDVRKKQMPIARERLIKDSKSYLSLDEYKQFTRDLENKRKDKAIINIAKKMLLERYFNGLVVKNKHIKEFI